MSEHQVQQRVEWEAFVAQQHAKGLCEFSGMRVSICVQMVCDCFETPEGAAEIERKADGHVCAECAECIRDGHQCCGCYDNACCHIPATPTTETRESAGESES